MQNLSQVRSRTDPSHEHHHRDKLHLPKRLLTGSGKDQSYLQAAKDTVQSAIELKPPISFDHLLRRDKKSSDPNKSHHHSPQLQPQIASLSKVDQTNPPSTPSTTRPNRPITRQDVDRARRANDQREASLRTTLKQVEDAAMQRTRELDDTYYTILDRAAALTALVSSLRRLAEESGALRAQFGRETRGLVDETTAALDAFGGFDAPEAAIEGLAGRLEAARKETRGLDERLERARERVERYEMRVAEKRRTARKRWRVGYGVVCAVVVLLVALLVARRRATIGSRMHTVAKAVVDSGNGIASPVAALFAPSSGKEEDPYLRDLFDDL